MSRLARKLLLLPGVLGGGGVGIQLPSTNLLFLFDPSVGVFADAALSTPASDGGALHGLEDRSANAYSVTQPGADSIAPVWRASVAEFGGKPAIEFGGNDFLIRPLAASIIGNLTTYSVYVVYRSAQATDGSLWSEGKSDSAVKWIDMEVRGGANAGQTRAFHVDDLGTYTTNLISHSNNNNDNTARLYTLSRRASADFSVYLNAFNERDNTNAPGSTTMDQLLLGARGLSTKDQYFNGQIALIAAYSADNRTTIEPLIQSYFGLCNTYFADVEKSYFAIGDSKTVGWNDPARDPCGGFGYPFVLSASLTTTTGNKWRELHPRSGHDGGNTGQIAAAINADLAATTQSPAPQSVLINCGTNDLTGGLPAEAAWKASMNTIIDAVHTKWPSAIIFLAKPVALSDNPPSAPVAATATLHGWIDDLIALYAYVSEGLDETDLENADGYVTYFADYLHPNNVGYAQIAALYQALMGF